MPRGSSSASKQLSSDNPRNNDCDSRGSALSLGDMPDDALPAFSRDNSGCPSGPDRVRTTVVPSSADKSRARLCVAALRTAPTCAGESIIEIEGSSSSLTATTLVRRSDRRAARSIGPCAWRAIVLHIGANIGPVEAELSARNRNVALAQEALPRPRNLCQGNLVQAKKMAVGF
jgi:hypothetical protein